MPKFPSLQNIQQQARQSVYEKGNGLTLTRFLNEAVIVKDEKGNQLEISVAELNGSRVRLRFVGDKEHFQVDRKEIALAAE